MTDYLTTAEAAEAWGVSERSVRNYCAQGRVLGAIRKEAVRIAKSDIWR